MALHPLNIGGLISRVPIVQGGMGVGISMSGLASAVANEGGIGVISAAMPGIHEPDCAVNGEQANIRVLRREIRRARLMTNGILGVNIMVALTDYGNMVRTAIEEGIDIIFAGAGLPLDLPGYLAETSRTKLSPIVSSGRAAKLICKKWHSRYNYLPDAVVVEGPKAGGHIGFKAQQIENPSFALERLLIDVIKALEPFETAAERPIPVIAAGGIYTGKDIYDILALGAAGVQLGTRFVATFECDADPAFKQTYVDARKDDMVVIKSPVGLPGRAVNNRFLEAVEKGGKAPFKCPYQCLRTCDSEKSPYCIAMALGNAKKGRFKYGFAFAGQNAYRVDRIVSVNELISSLIHEYSLAMFTQEKAAAYA
jgi:nitronate monooxygenase